MHGDAGVGAYPDGLHPAGVDEAYIPLQGDPGPEKVLDHRQDPLPGSRETDAVAAAHQEGKADVLFQAVHHVGQAGLGIAQHLRRPGKAARAHRHHQRLQFFGLHRPPLLSRFHVIMSYMCYTPFSEEMQ